MIPILSLCFHVPCRTTHPDTVTDTYLESCGIADLVTTCYGGRNRYIGEAYVKENPRKSMEELEKTLLAGQKLQGPMTALEVGQKIKEDGKEKR